jgi:NTP pyrophosphatase (non-canonical NTP hydrolase)
MIDQYKIATFNHRHDVTEDQQLKCLMEEVGELAEAYNRGACDEDVAEELADVLFVARSLAEFREIQVTGKLNEVIDENMEKSESTDGEKVTKTEYGVTDD